MRGLRQIEQHLVAVEFPAGEADRKRFALNLFAVFTPDAVDEFGLKTLTNIEAMLTEMPLIEQVELGINAIAPSVRTFRSRNKVH